MWLCAGLLAALDELVCVLWPGRERMAWRPLRMKNSHNSRNISERRFNLIISEDMNNQNDYDDNNNNCIEKARIFV